MGDWVYSTVKHLIFVASKFSVLKDEQIDIVILLNFGSFSI